jgi:hypothetical protein
MATGIRVQYSYSNHRRLPSGVNCQVISSMKRKSLFFSVCANVPSEGYRYAMQNTLDIFIMDNAPGISLADAVGRYGNASVPAAENLDLVNWPLYSLDRPAEMKVSTTGGEVELIRFTDQLTLVYYLRSSSRRGHKQ